MDAEALLTKLVSMPTISSDIAANDLAVTFVEDYLSKRGMHCERFRYDGHSVLLATTQSGSRNPKITLYGHIDVMDANTEAFVPRRDGDRLYGRGTYDMKFAIAAYMHMVDTLQENLSDYDFGILIVTDEEIGGVGGIVGLRSFLQDQYYQSDICLMPDGSNDWNIERAAKGWWRFTLTAQGQTAHSSRPWEGDNAAFKLVQALNDLREQFADHGPDTDTLNIGRVVSNGSHNQIPDHMSASVEIRLSSEDSPAINEARLVALCQKYNLKYRTDALIKLLRQDTHHPLFKTYKDSVEHVTGYRPQETLSNGGSDASYFTAVGVPCIITYLPGGGHHSANEWISLPDFLKFPAVVQRFVEQGARRAVTPVDKEVSLV